MKRITTSIRIDTDVKEMGLKDAIEVIGTRNLSAYITFLIKKNNRKIKSDEDLQ